MMDTEQIEKRIAELKKQQDAFLAQVNQGLGEYAGRIAELERLLAAMQKPPETQDHNEEK